MARKSWGGLLVGLLLFSPLQAEPITICTDQNFWYPFTYTENRVPKGVHIDVVNRALTQLGYEVKFSPRPWKRCLNEVEQGRVDGVVSASWKPQRARFLHYPEDAASALESKSRITQVEYVVVTHQSDPYQFQGVIDTLPTPVRVPVGYSIEDDLNAAGLRVETARGDLLNLKKLMRDRSGSVVTLPDIIKIMKSKGEPVESLKMHPLPFKSKSYFLAFSKRSRLSSRQMGEIWEKISEVRENGPLMMEFLLRYQDHASVE